jgi:hypothetical protein
MRSLIIIILNFVLISGQSAFSQNENYSDKGIFNTRISIDKMNFDSIGVIKKSPGGAALRSAIIPGLGQIYNESYWKIPIIYGIGAFFAIEYNRFDKKFKNYAALHDEYQNLYGVGSWQSETYKLYREFYRDYRDSFIWYFALLYIVNILDAYIDAHLFDFNVNSDIQLKFDPHDKGYRLKFGFNF